MWITILHNVNVSLAFTVVSTGPSTVSQPHSQHLNTVCLSAYIPTNMPASGIHVSLMANTRAIMMVAIVQAEIKRMIF